MAWESATVEAAGKAIVSAWDRAAVDASEEAHVRAWGRATVKAHDSAAVEAWDQTAVTAAGSATVTTWGGAAVTSAEEWCELYGVDVSDGVAILFKAVDADFKSRFGMSYAPGTRPVAGDWDGGESRCGGGLHFSPRPYLALEFTHSANRYVACPVRLAAMVVLPGPYQNKVKAKEVCAPVYEVDENGLELRS
jgi:hypothetical protein